METEKLVGQTLVCGCGKTHEIDPREVLYAEDAIERLPEVCGRHCGGRRAAVLMDVRTREAAGADAAAALARDGWRVREVLVADRAGGMSPVCDKRTKEDVGERIGPVDVVVSVGAGVISDLGKWNAFEMDLPAVTLATAASMNGYAAANVASAVGGVKVMIRARPPVAVLAAPAVLQAAPRELTASGLGDVLAKSVSSTDWRMNHLLFGDDYCERSVGLIAEIEPLYLEDPAGVGAGEPRAVEALFDACLLTGIAMTMAGSSDPASGGEHLISHTLDMRAAAAGVEHDLHGRQVGVGTILASELYRRVLATDGPPCPPAAQDVDRAFWGPLSDVVAEHYASKLARLGSARRKLRAAGAWDGLRRELAPMVRDPATIRDCLRRAGGAHRAEDLGVNHDQMRQVLLCAHQMRGRFTILDLARLAGVLPDAAGDVVDQWA